MDICKMTERLMYDVLETDCGYTPQERADIVAHRLAKHGAMMFPVKLGDKAKGRYYDSLTHTSNGKLHNFKLETVTKEMG